MIDVKEWCDYVSRHPLKFRFRGLHDHGRDMKSSFFKTAVEAASSSESYMSDLRTDEYNGHKDTFEMAVHDRRDYEGYLSRFCEYLENVVSHRAWLDSGIGTHDWPRTDIQTLLRAVEIFGRKHTYDYLDDCVGELEVDEGEEEFLLTKHKPVAAWSHAGDDEIPLEDIFFVCPSCHGEPQTEERLKDFYGEQNGYPRFYCGSCGAEMCVGRQDNILDFFLALDIKPYPFNKEKQAHWAKLLEVRKADGENKLGVRVGDLVHLEAYTDDPLDRSVNYLRAPGDLVRCTAVHEKSMSYEYVNDSGHGGIVWDHVWSRAEPVHGARV